MTSGFATLWMDPAVSGERALTVDALFSTTIADTKAFEASVKVDVPSRSGLTFGKPIFIWNHFRTGFYMKLPVRTLGNATNVRITFPKAAGKWTAADGRHPVVQPGFRQAFVSYTIPAADSLYKMGEASLSPTCTETLEQVYELVLRPSLLTKPSGHRRGDARHGSARTHERGGRLAHRLAQSTRRHARRTRARHARPRLDRAGPRHPVRQHPPSSQGPARRLPPSGASRGLRSRKGRRALRRLDDRPCGGRPRRRSRIPAARQHDDALGLENPHAHGRRRRPHPLAHRAHQGSLPCAHGPELARTRDRHECRGPLRGCRRRHSRCGGRRFASLPLDEAKLPGGRAGLFQITLTGEKKTKDGWGVAAIAAKRVLVTDTALIAKTSRDGSHVVHAADLVRGVPAAGLRAVLLGANGVPLETVTTDETGAARFATTRGLERERRPPPSSSRTKQRATSLGSLSDASNVDHDHDFSTAGRLVSEDGLTGLVFSERGIYRPGETVHAGMIVKTADWHRLPRRHARDAAHHRRRGPHDARDRPALTPEGTASADWTIPTDAVPGEIRIDLLAGDVVLSTHHAAIGDFTPEAMRPYGPHGPRAPGWMKPGDLGIDATLAMSYGAPAAKKAMRARLVLSPARDISFPELPVGPSSTPRPSEGTLDEVKVRSPSRRTPKPRILTLPLSSTAGTLKGRLLLEG